MRSIGFKTFGDFWDESYDEEENNDKRFEKVFNLLMKFDKMPIEELHKLYIDMIPTLKYNYDLIVERGSMKHLTENLEKNITEEK
jgi:phytoene dehydrogenase-like protein